MLRIIQNRRYFYAFTAVLVIASFAAVIAWGFKPGIDFTGGSMMEVGFTKSRPSIEALASAAQTSTGMKDLTVQPLGEQGMVLRMPPLDEPNHQKLLKDLKAGFEKDGVTVTEDRFESIGPIIGAELRVKTIYAVVLAIVAMVLYITYTFRKVSYPVASWKYGLCNIAALIHDVIIPSGLFAVLGHFFNVEVGAWVVTALLTILGFSVHDTIVVFDRIRENLSLGRRESFEELVNRSMNETLHRSLNTSLTVILVLAAAYFFGGESTKDFILTMLVGIAAGTYSSIFLASPLLVTWYLHDSKKKR
jgi:preprotein translocase subunit SecF